MPPLVSILVPCYNQTRFVRQAVASALAQDYAPVEIIVVDDGSTDDPRAALGELVTRPNVRFIRQENRGAAAARNRGLAAASGEFVKLLDGDDWLDPTIVRCEARALMEDARLGWVYCDYWRCDENGETLGGGRVGEHWHALDGNIFWLLLVSGFFPPVTVMARSRALDAIGGFDETLHYAEDYDLVLRLALHGYPARFIPEPLAYYRVHGQGKSRNPERAREARRVILNKLVSQYPRQTAAALYEIGDRFHQVKQGEASALGNLRYHQMWLEQLQADKAALQRAADAREGYLVRLEKSKLFRLFLRLGVFSRRTEG